MPQTEIRNEIRRLRENIEGKERVAENLTAQYQESRSGLAELGLALDDDAWEGLVEAIARLLRLPEPLRLHVGETL